jgi:hypothetical protein
MKSVRSPNANLIWRADLAIVIAGLGLLFWLIALAKAID